MDTHKLPNVLEAALPPHHRATGERRRGGSGAAIFMHSSAMHPALPTLVHLCPPASSDVEAWPLRQPLAHLARALVRGCAQVEPRAAQVSPARGWASCMTTPQPLLPGSSGCCFALMWHLACIPVPCCAGRGCPQTGGSLATTTPRQQTLRRRFLWSKLTLQPWPARQVWRCGCNLGPAEAAVGSLRAILADVSACPLPPGCPQPTPSRPRGSAIPRCWCS